MNQFDFYVVKANSRTIRPLVKAGISRTSIQRRRDGCSVYGRAVYPRWSYTATLGYFETNQSDEADKLAAEWRAKGVPVSVAYHCAD